MEDLLDMIIGDESPSAISDKIKDILYTKSTGKIEDLRPSISNGMFEGGEDEDEDEVEE